MTATSRTHRAPGSAPIAIAIISLTLAACGGTGPTGTPASAGAGTPGSTVDGPTTGSGGTSSIDACSLLSDDDLRDVTGFPVISESPGPQLGIFPVGCQWELDSGQGVAWKATVGLITPGGRSYYDTYFAPFEGEPIQGIGDVALRREKDDVMAVKGDTLISVTYTQIAGPHEGFAEALLKLAVARL